MPCSLPSTWNKPNQPSTKLNDHIAGQAEDGTTFTAIGEVANGSINCFCHWHFNKLIKKKQSHFLTFFSYNHSSPISAYAGPIFSYFLKTYSTFWWNWETFFYFQLFWICFF
jgi:hypothetical protein